VSRATGWTAERRERQRVAIASWKPWEASTGPKTAEGKAVSSRNADRGVTRQKVRAELRYFRRLIGDLEEQQRGSCEWLVPTACR
jgi:hypothetical protein